MFPGSAGRAARPSGGLFRFYALRSCESQIALRHRVFRTAAMAPSSTEHAAALILGKEVIRRHRIEHSPDVVAGPWAVRSGRSVTACEPHSKHRIFVRPSVRGEPYIQLRTRVSQGAVARALTEPSGPLTRPGAQGLRPRPLRAE